MHQFRQTWTIQDEIIIIIFFYCILFFFHNFNSLIFNCITHYLFYVAAFSATFKWLYTIILILNNDWIKDHFFCTTMSKSAEPRAEQQARLIAMPRRESFSAPQGQPPQTPVAVGSLLYVRPPAALLSISLTKLQMIWILCNCKIASVHDCAIYSPNVCKIVCIFKKGYVL